MTESTALPLTLLAYLPSPSGTSRTWQSAPHPSASQPLLATASADKSVNIWSLRDFRLLSTISGGHKRSIRAVGWKDYGVQRKKRRLGDNETAEPEKKQPVILATGSFDANVGIWVHNDEYGKTTAGADDDGVFDVNDKDGEEEEEEWHFSTLLTGPDSEIKSLAFSPPHYSANLLAMSSRDKSVWVWEEVEEDEWETIAVLQEHAGDVKCVAWCAGAKQKAKSEEEYEEKILGSREILASGSYDDTIRLWRDVEEEGDWICVGVIEGHGGTVWGVCWENFINTPATEGERWEPRLASGSDDLTVRIWKRELSEAEREKQANGISGGRRLPSIIRPTTSMERWVEETILPVVHVRSVYAIDWSSRTGLLVSCGGDGTIAVYKEESGAEDAQGNVLMDGTGTTEEEGRDKSTQRKSNWQVVALVEGAHDEFEINHVCWASRKDPKKRNNDEEVIVSTGDDGVVRIWTLPDDIV